MDPPGDDELPPAIQRMLAGEKPLFVATTRQPVTFVLAGRAALGAFLLLAGIALAALLSLPCEPPACARGELAPAWAGPLVAGGLAAAGVLLLVHVRRASSAVGPVAVGTATRLIVGGDEDAETFAWARFLPFVAEKAGRVRLRLGPRDARRRKLLVLDGLADAPGVARVCRSRIGGSLGNAK